METPFSNQEQLELFGRLTRLTVSQAFPIFHELEGHYKSYTYARQYKPIVRILGDRFLDQIGEFDISNYRDQRALEGKKGSTINREQSIIGRVFSCMRKWKKAGRISHYDFSQLILPDENPASLVRRADETAYVRTVVLEKKDFQSFLEYAHPNVRRICLLAVLTLLRRKDIMMLNKENFNRALNQLQGVQSKTGKPYKVPTCTTVSVILKQAKFDFICDFTNFRKLFERARKESGVYFQFKDLRRTGATHMLLQGVDLRTIQKVLGHTNMRMTERYLQPKDDHSQMAVNKLDDVISSEAFMFHQL